MAIRFLAKLSILRKPLFTETVKRFTFWNVGIFLLILIAFNIFIILTTNTILNESLDLRIKHEAENIIKSFELDIDSIIVIDEKEFEETDLNEISGHAFLLQIYNSNGKILFKSDNINLFGNLPVNTNEDFEDFKFKDIEVFGKSLRAGYLSLRDKAGRKSAYLQLAAFKEEYSSILNQIILFNLFSFPLIIIIVVITSFFLAKNSINPLNKIIETAKNISASNLSLRIEHTASPVDELGKLRDTLNNLFHRLEKHIKQISQFTDHASHQLMNPLTAFKTQLDYILKKERTTGEYKETLQFMQEQTDRMISIIKALLIIAREDRAMANKKNLFNASGILKSFDSESFSDSDIHLEIEDDIYLKGDSEMFKMAIENLVDNAIKFSNNEPVKVILKVSKGTAEVAVIDFGLGINDEEKTNVFERFYRSEKAEKLGIKGYGLGLSLVKSIVSQFGGTIKIEDNIPKGTKIIILIPSVEIE